MKSIGNDYLKCYACGWVTTNAGYYNVKRVGDTMDKFTKEHLKEKDYD